LVVFAELALFAEDPGEALEDVVDAVAVLVVIRVAHHPPAQLNVLLPPLVAGGEIRDIPDHDVDQHLDVVGVEEIRGGLAAQQIHEELEERVRGLRLVLEDPDGIVCKPIVVVSLRTSTRRYSRSRFSSRRIFSVKVLATSRSSSAFNTGLSELSWNCRLKEMMQLRNRSGICSSMSVSGGYSTLLRRNDKKLPPRSSWWVMGMGSPIENIIVSRIEE
jgi:hypothetical protein